MFLQPLTPVNTPKSCRPNVGFLNELLKKKLPTEVDKERGNMGNIQTEDITDSADDMVPLCKHPIYIKYFNMKKFGHSVDAVKHKMFNDNIDPTILDLDPESIVSSKLTVIGNGFPTNISAPQPQPVDLLFDFSYCIFFHYNYADTKKENVLEGD